MVKYYFGIILKKIKIQQKLTIFEHDIPLTYTNGNEHYYNIRQI